MFTIALYSKKLTLDEAVINSPFKIASLGWHAIFPNENAILMVESRFDRK